MSSFDFVLNGAECKKENVSNNVENGFNGIGFLKEVSEDYQPIFGQREPKRRYHNASSEPLAPLAKRVKTEVIEQPAVYDFGSSMTDMWNDSTYIPYGVYNSEGYLQPQPINEESYEQLLDDKPENIRFIEYKQPANVPKEAIDKPKRKRVIDREKTVFQYPHLVALGLMNSPNEVATAAMLYNFIEYHFPSITIGGSWKNTLRHALAEKYGFCKNKLTDNGKSFYWAFIPERRSGLIKEVHNKINENEGSMEKLRMRNIGDLPALLAGTFAIPNRKGHAERQLPKMRRIKRIRHVKEIKKEVHNQPQYHGVIPQNYWNYHQIPSTSYNPNYSNQYQPAYQPLHFQDYVNLGNQQFMDISNNYAQYVQYYGAVEVDQEENLINL